MISVGWCWCWCWCCSWRSLLLSSVGGRFAHESWDEESGAPAATFSPRRFREDFMMFWFLWRNRDSCRDESNEGKGIFFLCWLMVGKKVCIPGTIPGVHTLYCRKKSFCFNFCGIGSSVICTFSANLQQACLHEKERISKHSTTLFKFKLNGAQQTMQSKVKIRN